MPHSLLEHYDQAVLAEKLEADSSQQQLALRLDALADALSHKNPDGFLRRLFGKSASPQRGLYIWGGVGRGKTMLMDMFFETLPVRKKRRLHFHAFMRDVHRAIFQEREKQASDPLQKTASGIARQTRVLCFDEFAVTDVADAMILSRLFGVLFAKGVSVVATSNMPPQELYKDGLNRPLFEPFIALIHQHMDVVHVNAARDYRLEKFEKSGVYFSGAQGSEKLETMWRLVTGGRGAPVALGLNGRALRIERSFGGAAWLQFAQLCDAPLGAQDYLELAQEFHTLFLEGIPHFTSDRRNALRRFINLVDILYDHGVNLIASAEAEPDGLLQDIGGYESQAYARTASRLMDMRSKDYLAKPHRPAAEQLEKQDLSR